MRKLITVFTFLFLFFTAGLAQSTNGLILKKYGSQKSIFVKEDTKVKIIKNGKTYKGKFKVVSDQAILINEDTIPISQIQKLNAKTSSSKLGGTALLVPGGLVGAGGTALTIAGLASLSEYGIIGVVIGAPSAVLGIFVVVKGVQLLSNGRKFDPSKWEYTISYSLPLEARKQP